MIKHVNGDIFTTNADIIIHQVNCQGVMGAGVAKQVKDRYPFVYNLYKRYCEMQETKNMLGKVLIVNALDEKRIYNKERSLFIANFFSQDTYGYEGRFTDYKAFRNCLEYMKDNYSDFSMAIPYLIGCRRGGGDWEVIYKMIEEILGDCDVTIYEYDLG